MTRKHKAKTRCLIFNGTPSLFLIIYLNNVCILLKSNVDVDGDDDDDGQTRAVLCLNNLDFSLMHKMHHAKITILCLSILWSSSVTSYT